MGGDLELADYRAAGTSSGLTEPSPVKNRKCKIGWSSCCLLFGAACIILAGVIPVVIDRQIHNGVLDAALLDPSTMTDSALAKFYNGTNYETVYLYNITNLYEVLTAGAIINYEEVGPLVFNRYNNRYNVSWDTDNSKVTHQWLNTLEITQGAELLDQPIINVNPFFLGVGAQVMQQYIALLEGEDPTSVDWTPTVDFPGNFLSEKLAVTGFFGSLMEEIVPVFLNQTTGDFLTTVRGSAIAFYAQFVPAYCTAQSLSKTEALASWANGTLSPYLSDQNPYYWTGFELSAPLQSTYPSLVASNAFDSTNGYGIASVAGLEQWSTFATLYAADSSSTATLTQAAAIMTSLQMDSTTDLVIIGAWIKKLASALPDSSATSVGSAYLKTVCAAVAAMIEQAVTTPGNNSFAIVFEDVAAYTPSSWADIGALQFGTGAVVGVSVAGSTTLTTGTGLSISVLPTTSSTAPFRFNDNATEAEPIEFTAGIQYYIDHNNVTLAETATWPAGYSQAILWQTNPLLLYVNNTDTLINLNIAQSTAFLQTLAASTSNLGLLITALATPVLTYSTYFKAMYSAYGVTIAVATATEKAEAAFEAAVAADTTNLLVNAGVTKTNYYAVWCYLYNYLGNEFGGTLAQLDPTSGIAPQNSGLFTKRTVRENLFGYDSRFGADVATIPSITKAPEFSATDYQALLNTDYEAHIGREWVEDTGNADYNTVGQWRNYEGSAGYETACELNDPNYETTCAGTLKDNNNWQVWNGTAVIAGTGSSLQIQPFLEDDADRVEYTTMYVSDLFRGVEIQYEKDVTVKDIDVRRYILNQQLINASYGSQPNPHKNEVMWKQADVPDGFFSLQTVNDGIPGMSSIPHWGFADSKVFIGCTCGGANCSTYYNETLHQTYVDIHPLTGLSLRGMKRLQGNFRLSAQEYWTGPAATATGGYSAYPAALPEGYDNSTVPGGFNYMYNNLFVHTDTLYVPYYWAEIYDVLTDDDAETLKHSLWKIKIARRARTGVIYGGYIGGAIIFVVSLAALVSTLKASTTTSAPIKGV